MMKREPEGAVSVGISVPPRLVVHSLELRHSTSLRCTPPYPVSRPCTVCPWHNLLSARSLISIRYVWSLSKSGALVVGANCCSILYSRNANVTSLSSSRDQRTHLPIRSSINRCLLATVSVVTLVHDMERGLLIWTTNSSVTYTFIMSYVWLFLFITFSNMSLVGMRIY